MSCKAMYTGRKKERFVKFLSHKNPKFSFIIWLFKIRKYVLQITTFQTTISYKKSCDLYHTEIFHIPLFLDAIFSCNISLQALHYLEPMGSIS